MPVKRLFYSTDVEDPQGLAVLRRGTSNTRFAHGVANGVDPNILFRECQQFVSKVPMPGNLIKLSGKRSLLKGEYNSGQRSVLVKLHNKRKISEIYVMDRSLRIDLLGYNSVTNALRSLGRRKDRYSLTCLQDFSQANTVSIKDDFMKLYFAAGAYGRLKVVKKYSFNNKGGLKSEEQCVVKIESLEDFYRTVVDYGPLHGGAKLQKGGYQLFRKLWPGSRLKDLENELRVGQLLYPSLDGGKIGNKFYVLQKQGISYKNDYFKSFGDQCKIQQTLADLLIVRELYRLEQKGYLHNDFKEANVIFFLDEDKNIKELRLIDFGMASRINDKCSFSFKDLSGFYYFAPELRRESFSKEEEGGSWTKRTQMYQVLHEAGIDITKYPELAYRYSRWRYPDGERPNLESLYDYLRKSLKGCCFTKDGCFDEITERFNLPRKITSVDIGREAKAGATRREIEAAAEREAAAAAGENLNIVQGTKVFKRGERLKIILNTLIDNIDRGSNLQHDVMVAQQFIKQLESNHSGLMTNTYNPFKFCVRKCTSFWKESSRQSALTTLKAKININAQQEGNFRELTQ